MNSWGSIKPLVILEADDFQDKYDRNGLEMLFYWKAKYPKFKITLFTIPNKTTFQFMEMVHHAQNSSLLDDPWVEFAVHGWDHDSNFECWGWDYEKTKIFMNKLSEPEINRYHGKTFPLDKAGGFDIEGRGGLFIKRIEGCYSNVIGLPLAKLRLMLKKFGVDVL